LLAFTRSQQGAMVKRLHMGRACEAGISAARLAQGGFTGPETVLEGRFGYLEVFCRDAEPALLTRGLGQDWETLKICLKRYACHVTAQAPVQALRELMQAHGFTGDQVQHLELDCSDKVISHHDLRDPQDVMQAQYSVPFCLAMALFHDPQDPAAFNDAALADSRIRSACAAVRLAPAADLPSAWSARLRVVLKDGRQWQQEAKAFKGMPGDELTAREERQRFELLCASLPATQSAQLYERLSAIELHDSFPQADMA
jgi:2-methylcitrate dehydratase PrpD